MARIDYVQDDQASPEQREALAASLADRGVVSDFHRLLVHVPPALHAFLDFSKAIKATPLSADLRELVILRVSQLVDNEFEWRRHTALGVKAGLAEAQVVELWTWQDSAAFDDTQRAVMALVDEYVTTRSSSDDTVAAARAVLGDDGVAGVCLTMGFYLLVAAVLVPLDIMEDDQAPPSALVARDERRRA